jgi:outer membrane protein assembly factor BamD
MSKWYFLFISIVLLFSSCKSEFERVRLSGDVDRIYQKGIALYEEEDYNKAQTLFELIINNFRGKREAEDLYFKYAYTHYFQRNYILAAHYFKTFAATFPLSGLRQEAEFMAAYANYRMSPVYRLDQSFTVKAIDGFQDFANAYPQSERVPECNRLIDQMRTKLERKAFAESKLYYDLREYEAALHSFENLLRDFPESRDVERVRYLMALAAAQWANNSVRDKQEPRYQKALQYAELFKSKYQKSNYLSDIIKIENQAREALKTFDHVQH